jgi:hypothetical protein
MNNSGIAISRDGSRSDQGLDAALTGAGQDKFGLAGTLALLAAYGGEDAA